MTMEPARVSLGACARITIATLAVAISAPALAQQISYSGGIQATRGDYFFTEQTSALYVLNTISYHGGRFQAALSLPFIVQSTPFASYGPAGVIPTGGPAHASVRSGRGRGGRHADQPVPLPDTLSSVEAGLGDPSMLAGIDLLPDAGWWPSTRLVAGVKMPLGDVERGMSTGAWDLGGGLSFAKMLGSRILFLDAMYWRFGDMPDLEIKDALGYGAGIGQALFGGRLAVLGSLSGFTEIVEGVKPPLQMTVAASFRVGRQAGINGSVSAGLSESSSDVAASLGIRWDLVGP